MYTNITISAIKLAEIVQGFVGVLLIVIISIRMYEFTVIVCHYCLSLALGCNELQFNFRCQYCSTKVKQTWLLIFIPAIQSSLGKHNSFGGTHSRPAHVTDLTEE